MRPARGLLVVATCVLVAAACSGEPEEVVRTSGPLADGFEIEPGSGVVGAVFPVALPYGGDWQAILRVDGDLQRVFEGYIQQAEDLGYSFDSEFPIPGGQRCGRPEDVTAADDLDEEFLTRCSVNGSGPDGLEFFLERSVAADGDGHVYLSIKDYSEASAPPTLPSDGPIAPATDVDLVPGWTANGDERSVRVVQGSEVIYGPDVDAGIGYTVIVQVPDDLMPVMRGYEARFTAAGFTSRGLVGSADEPILETSTAGGGTLIAVGVAGNPSYVLITRENDP
jgi:hypothetical protein